MKRGFLSGLGSYFCSKFLAGLLGFPKNWIIGAIIVVVSASLAVLTFLAAYRAVPNRSWAHAVIGGLIGYLIIDTVILSVYFLLLLSPYSWLVLYK